MLFRVLLFSMLVLNINVIAQNQFKVAAIGFYNCEHFFDAVDDTAKNDDDYTPDGIYHYNTIIYEQKKHNIATVIARMGTDVTQDGPAILGLTEVENDRVLADLTAAPEISSRNYKYIWARASESHCYNVALLYSPKYFTVISWKYIHVPVETIRQKKQVRDVLCVAGILAGDTVGIVVCHLPAEMGSDAASIAVRTLAVQTCKGIVDSQLTLVPNAKVILIGDLNDNPNGDICKVLKAKEHRSGLQPDELYSPWVEKYKNGAGTEEYHGEWYLTDQVLVSGGLVKSVNHKWQFYNDEIYKKDWVLYPGGRYKGFPHKSFTTTHVWDNGYSNHLPVLIYLVEKK